MKLKKPVGNEQGFTIVELIVTMVVGGMLIASVGLLLNTYSSMGRRTYSLSVANAFAERKIEQLRSQGFLAVNTGTTNITSDLPSSLLEPRSASLTVSNVSTDVKKVELSLSYKTQNQTINNTYTTYLGELGVGQY